MTGYKCPLPSCDNVSALSWRCDECGKLFEESVDEVPERETSVGG